jgi:hypothetical protein
VQALDEYLEDETLDRVYSGEIRAEAHAVRNAMNALREKLDAPPSEPFGEIEFKVEGGSVTS